MAVLLVLAVVGGAVALQQRGVATDRQRLATAHQLSLTARSLVASDPALAGLVAVEAFRLHPDAETRGAVVSAAAVGELRTEIDAGGPTKYGVAVSPDGTLVASGGARRPGGAVGRADRRRAGHVVEHDGLSARQVEFSDDGGLLASTAIEPVGGDDRAMILVWDVASRRPVLELRRTGLTQHLAFSGDGSRLAVGYRDGSVETIDVPSGNSSQVDRASRARPVAQLQSRPVVAGHHRVHRRRSGRVGRGHRRPGRRPARPARSTRCASPRPDGWSWRPAKHNGVTGMGPHRAHAPEGVRAGEPDAAGLGRLGAPRRPRGDRRLRRGHHHVGHAHPHAGRDLPGPVRRGGAGRHAEPGRLGARVRGLRRHDRRPAPAGPRRSAATARPSPTSRSRPTAGSPPRAATARCGSGTADGRPLATLAGHPDTVEAVAFGPDGTRSPPPRATTRSSCGRWTGPRSSRPSRSRGSAPRAT